MVIWVFSLVFQGFRGFGREGNSLVNLGVFLDKTEQPRKGRTGFLPIFFAEENRASWGLKKSRDFFLGAVKTRRRSRRESRDFGTLSSAILMLGVIIQGPFRGRNKPHLGHFKPLLSHFKPPQATLSHLKPLKAWVLKVPKRGLSYLLSSPRRPLDFLGNSHVSSRFTQSFFTVYKGRKR